MIDTQPTGVAKQAEMPVLGPVLALLVEKCEALKTMDIPQGSKSTGLYEVTFKALVAETDMTLVFGLVHQHMVLATLQGTEQPGR